VITLFYNFAPTLAMDPTPPAPVNVAQLLYPGYLFQATARSEIVLMRQSVLWGGAGAQQSILFAVGFRALASYNLSVMMHCSR